MSSQRRRRLALRALLGLPWLATSLDLRGADAPPLPRVGSLMPLVDVPLLDGTTFRASDAEGRVLVVYWWASWCPFCAIQTPTMQALWDALRALGLSLIGVSVNKRTEDARRHLARHGYTFPSAFLSPGIQRSLAQPGKGLPVTVVRGRDGRVALAEAGQMFAEDIQSITRLP